MIVISRNNSLDYFLDVIPTPSAIFQHKLGDTADNMIRCHEYYAFTRTLKCYLYIEKK